MHKNEKNWQTWRHTVGHKSEEKSLQKPTLSVINAGPPDRVSVLSTKCGGCHPKGLIVASSHKIKQVIMTLDFLHAKADSPFC